MEPSGCSSAQRIAGLRCPTINTGRCVKAIAEKTVSLSCAIISHSPFVCAGIGKFIIVVTPVRSDFAMPASATPKTILEGIVQWSTTRPLWQQDALRRIIRTGSLTDADIDSLTGLVKQAHGATDAGVAAEPLTAVHIPSRPAGSASVLLTSISCVEGVNQLAAEQTLIFETGGLTIVYGPNGSGKSGYSRILKRACRARMPGEILPDVSKPDPVEPRATISALP